MAGEERKPELVASGSEESAQTTPAGAQEFRWQAIFQKSTEALFLLNRNRRILFVNKAWERLTGMSGTEARGLVCARRAPDPQDPWDLAVRALCYPPPEALKGNTSRVRRAVQRGEVRERWNIEFFPLRDEAGLLCILGRIQAEPRDETRPDPPLPEKLIGLREARLGRYRFQHFVSKLPAVQRALEQARLASATSVPVLLVGESGTGKEWLARAIHNESDFRDRAFVALDCPRIPPAMFREIIFGEHSTAPQRDSRTLYLRDPAFLPREMQMQLCREIASPLESAHYRVIAGSSTDPCIDIKVGRLLESFHCALSPLVISLPPLRERTVDLSELVERMLERASLLVERRISGLTPEAWELVRAYAWPGNLNELYVTLRGACARTSGDRIASDHFPAPIKLAVRMGGASGADSEKPISLDQVLEQAERRMIVMALRRAKGNKSKAADLLSIWRPRLIRRMEALGITGSQAD